MYPLDEVYFRYQVTGVKVDAEGKVDVETTMRLVNPNGKMVVEEKPPVERQLSLGGNTYTSGARLVVPAAEKAPPGEYSMSVQVRDKLGMETASFERKFTIKATTFQIIVPRFYHDADSKIPAPVGGLIGAQLWRAFHTAAFATVASVYLMCEALLYFGAAGSRGDHRRSGRGVRRRLCAPLRRRHAVHRGHRTPQ